MPNISKITLPNGTTYDIKDDAARGLVVHIYLDSNYTCTCDTTIERILSAIENGQNITCIVDDVDIYQTVFYDINETSVRFWFSNYGHEYLIDGAHYSNADHWTWQDSNPSTGTNVVFNQWTYN